MGNGNAFCCGSKSRKRKKQKEMSTHPTDSTPRKSATSEPFPSASTPSTNPRTSAPTIPLPAEASSHWDSDAILQLVQAAHNELMELVETSSSMPLLVNKPDMLIYGVETRRGFLMKSVWDVPHPPDTVLSFETNNEHRLQWDPNVSELRNVGHVTADVAITYERYKKMMIVSQRDLLTAGRADKFKQGILDCSVSVEVTSEPPIQGMVRAHLFVGGYDIQPTATGSTVTLYSELDFGGAIPKPILVKMSAMTLPGFIKAFRKGIEKFAEERVEDRVE